jgi:DNA repair protein RecO (recombination protein O)
VSAGRPPLDAFVVGQLDLGEADRVWRLLDPNEGRVSVVARAARKSQRRFSGIELGTRVRIVRGRGTGSLVSVASAERISGPVRARSSFERIALLGYGCELCAALAPEGGAAEKLFLLLEAWLALLEGDEEPGTASRFALEGKALTFAGLAPALSACAVCGAAISDPAVFDHEAGGAQHARCGGGRPLPATDLVQLDVLRRTPLAETPSLPVPASVGSWLLSDFAQHQLARPLRARALLEATIG